MKKSYTLVFTASGYGTDRTKYKTLKDAREAAEREAQEIAADHNARVCHYGDDEWVVIGSGDEIGRWEIF